jgi:hypothetical protein
MDEGVCVFFMIFAPAGSELCSRYGWSADDELRDEGGLEN